MKRRTIVITFGIGLGIVLLFVLIYYLGKNYFTGTNIYEMTWKINIPSDFKEIYQYQSPRGFHGDGTRYTIFKTEEMNAISMITSQKTEKIELQEGDSKEGGINNKEIEQYVNKVIAESEIPEIYKPQFTQYYSWRKLSKYGNDVMIILYFPDINRVYFIEELF